MEKLKQELKKENSLLQIKCDLIIDKMARAHDLEQIALKIKHSVEKKHMNKTMHDEKKHKK